MRASSCSRLLCMCLVTGAAPRPCLPRLCTAQTENLYDVLRPDRRLSPAVTHDPAVKAACRAGTEGLCRPVLISAAVKGAVCGCIALRCVPVAGHDGFRNWPATGSLVYPASNCTPDCVIVSASSADPCFNLFTMHPGSGVTRRFAAVDSGSWRMLALSTDARIWAIPIC